MNSHAPRWRSVFAASLATIVFGPSAAAAQSSGFGYAFGSPVMVTNIGLRSSAWQLGGGGEVWADRGISFGGELGYVYFPAVVRTYAYGYASASSFGTMTVSLNGSRHFLMSDNETAARPFVTGGMTFLLGREPIPLFNAGGGVDWWLKPRAGFRFEVRDQFFATSVGVGSAMLGFRAGVVFR